eukprot:TRINITY_DN1328_c0_g1_i1.p1 TRINITY_DN1328_c0_g1~~TRINITY_DN1328_c0_g1_i1.p1  ORF type:complete len:180 (-),score=6.08 TRINITY_DN1328_c0_g1_i1:383-922(-)
MLLSLAMVVSLWYNMVLSVLKISMKKSRMAKYIHLCLLVCGVVVVVVGVGAAMYALFLEAKVVIIAKSVVFAIYTISIFVVAAVSIHKSRRIWWRRDSNQEKGNEEFSRKVKIMIGLIVAGLLQMCVGFVLNLIQSPALAFFFILHLKHSWYIGSDCVTPLQPTLPPPFRWVQLLEWRC